MASFVTKTYSFGDVQVSFTAPSASFAIAGNGVADEGVSITMSGPKNVRTVGADGVAMNSLIVSNAGDVSFSLLKESPVNALLNATYRYQKTSSANWGGIVLTIVNPVTGDTTTCSGGAFQKQADLGYQPAGQNLRWTFEFADIEEILG